MEQLAYRFDLCAEQSPWLESVDGPALRTHLASLIGIATTFGSEEDDSPPSAAIASEFRPRADLNRPHSPARSTSPEDGGSGRFALSAGGRTSGRDFGRLRSSMCSKVLSICRRRRRLFFFAAAGRRDPYRAGRMRSKRRPVHGFEPGIVFATMVETIKIFCFQKWERTKSNHSPPLRWVVPGKRTTPSELAGLQVARLLG